ncbi:MAG: hypothetical protein A2252_08710 [Elusimicrobia bacterium RIFOXYA2_FULL_39_19]|nr:MAG: hypothetical protein A2252_08710 [Elusimicrobia bacterium RIFOXYA2_FULL_39_19]
MSKIYLIGLPVHRYTQPMLGLGYIGSALLKNGHTIKVHDMASENAGELSQIEKEVKEFNPDYAGISVLTAQINRSAEILKHIKSINNKIVTVMGGPHVSALPEYTLNTVLHADFCIAGEGDISFPEFVKLHSANADYSAIAGLCYRKEGKAVLNKPEIIKDISTLEFPWKLLNPLNYNKGELQGYTAKRRPVVTVVSSRGCPYRCTYCAQMSVFSYQFRVRDAMNFVDEMEYLNKNFGIKEIQLADDNFTFYRDHAVKVCNEILRRKLDISWALINGVRIDKLDKELLELMKKAGCYYMAFGLEFGSPRILKLCKKGLSDEGMKVGYENVKLASKMGFITHGFFLMGYPYEQMEDMEMTAGLIKALPLDRISIGVPVPYPGSEIFNYYMEKKFKTIENINWDDYVEGNFKPIWEYLSGNVVANKIRKTYLSFYTNPFNMLRFISKLRTKEQFFATFQGFRRGLLNTFLNIYKTK